MSSHPIAVFLGPSCALEEAKRHLAAADYFPPAARGSFYGIINDGYRRIVLIDGLFYGKLSVWHKEIMFALDCGIEVLGASSMGALRAAELEGTGIKGIGTIFGWYRDGVIDGDDEVALLHESGEDDYFPLTIPLVNLRWNLLAAEQHGVIGSSEAALVLERAKRLCFTERSLDAILSPLRDSPLRDTLDVASVETWLQNHGRDLKKLDALAALDWAASQPLSSSVTTRPVPRDYELVHVNAGIAYFQGERLAAIKAKQAEREVPLIDYLSRISPKDPAYRDLVRARSYQRLIVGWSRELRLDLAEPGEPGEPTTSIWDPARIDFEHRRASGLTLVDLAREDADATLSQAMQRRACHDASEATLSELARKLEAQTASATTANWGEMGRVDARLVYTLWWLAQRKGVARPSDAVTPAEHGAERADEVLRFALWIDEMGASHFGYTLDASREILLAHQHSNRLEILDERASHV